MLKLFFGNRSWVLLLLPVLITAYVVLNMVVEYHTAESPSQFGFWGSILEEDSWFSVIGAPVLCFVNAILLNALYNRNGFKEKNTFLLALLAVVIHSYFHSFYFLSGSSIALTFMMLSLLQLVKLDQNTDGRKEVFNASLLYGVAITFYPMLLIGIPFLFLIIWVFRPFILRESSLAMTGLLIPLIYGGVYRMVLEVPLDNEGFSVTSFEWKIPDIYVVGGAMFFITIFGLRPLSIKIQQSSIRLKKLFRTSGIVLLYFILLAVVEMVFFSKVEAVSFLYVPLLLMMTYGFGSKAPKVVPTIVFYGLFIFSVSKFFVSFNL